MTKIHVKGLDITVLNNSGVDEISLTDMVKNLDNNNVIVSNWMRQKNTLEFLSIWERLNNPDFKLIEFDELVKDAGLNRFNTPPKKKMMNLLKMGNCFNITSANYISSSN